MSDQIITNDITIILCTYNRHDLLRKALRSIASLRSAKALIPSVIVVDNSNDSNALPLVEEMRSIMPFPLSTVAASPPNISIARNAGVAASTSEFVAFIDDDQELDPGWLIAIDEALNSLPHDVILGSVEAVPVAPERMNKTVHMMFSRSLEHPTGHDLYAMGVKKTAGIALGSGNSVFRRSTTLTDAAPFDPSFGNGGGEDYDLFCRLQRRGRRFGWVPTAKVYELVPISRCEPDYLAARLYAGGQAFALAVSRNSAFPVMERMRQRIIAVLQLLLLLLRSAFLDQQDAAALMEYQCRKASLLGKLSFHPLRPIYREIPKPPLA